MSALAGFIITATELPLICCSIFVATIIVGLSALLLVRRWRERGSSSSSAEHPPSTTSSPDGALLFSSPFLYSGSIEKGKLDIEEARVDFELLSRRVGVAKGQLHRGRGKIVECDPKTKLYVCPFCDGLFQHKRIDEAEKHAQKCRARGPEVQPPQELRSWWPEWSPSGAC